MNSQIDSNASYARNDHTEGLKELSRASYKLHQELAKELDGPNTYGYRPMQTYSVVFDTSRKKARESSKEVDWINTHTVRSIEQIGTLETTSQLHPELFTRKLIKEAETSGRVNVRVGLGVTELLYDGDIVVGVLLSNGEKLNADKVVVCMGPWSGKLDLANQPNIPVKGSHVHSIVLKPNEIIPNHALFTAILENSKTSEPEVRRFIKKKSAQLNSVLKFFFQAYPRPVRMMFVISDF